HLTKALRKTVHPRVGLRHSRKKCVSPLSRTWWTQLNLKCFLPQLRLPEQISATTIKPIADTNAPTRSQAPISQWRA
ncbi:MAG: hypothetical protein ACK56I_28445, partial [bacterium]